MNTNDVFRYSDCPMHRSMAILGSKWKPIIIYALRERTARFGQLHSAIGSISKKVLTTTLKELEQDEILIREEFKELPPRVEYTLTEKGKALIPIMKELVNWDYKYSLIK
ncbi:winged helix-turn-helix transcriptional regulator [Zhouia sp. PK063]|uniref:winged helix-turn-helix transcriptional regulator n=1 Tax=Zhouia sp. PK063 TaxID=3373602 RepID=UPI00379DBC2F